jgi:hypothetical protein
MTPTKWDHFLDSRLDSSLKIGFGKLRRSSSSSSTSKWFQVGIVMEWQEGGAALEPFLNINKIT